jgi:two-component system, LytTR family, sensor histidine kinase AlgZ
MTAPDTASVPPSSTLDSSLSAPLSAAPAPRSNPGVAYDVCHGALALRATLGVNGAVLIASALTVDSAAQLAAAFGPVLAVALPATLVWLAVVCALRRPVTRLAPAVRVAALMALGGAIAVAAAWPVTWIGLLVPTPLRHLMLALAGAALALPLALWLQAREQARSPADARARLAELQARIHPHFLFNTLNTAIALVRSHPARAESVLEDLAELFHGALAEAGPGGAVTLASEIELARRYLAIESLRFGERLQLHWQLDPAADAARVPPLALQPLLENAVRHGIEPAEQGGTVRVRTRVQLGRAELLIDNSLPPAGAAHRAGHGLALANVRERLRLLHDLDAQFEAGPVGPGAGAAPTRWRVRIVVPLGDRTA